MELLAEKPDLQIKSHLKKHGFSSINPKQCASHAMKNPHISKNGENVNEQVKIEGNYT